MTSNRLALLCCALGLLPACDPPVVADAGTDVPGGEDAGRDTGIPFDAPRDTPPLGPGLPAQREVPGDGTVVLHGVARLVEKPVDARNPQARVEVERTFQDLRLQLGERLLQLGARGTLGRKFGREVHQGHQDV